MTGETLTIVFLDPRKRSHELNASRWEHAQNWAPQCARKECQQVSGVVRSAIVCAVSHQMRNALAEVFSF